MMHALDMAVIGWLKDGKVWGSNRSRGISPKLSPPGLGELIVIRDAVDIDYVYTSLWRIHI